MDEDSFCYSEDEAQENSGDDATGIEFKARMDAIIEGFDQPYNPTTEHLPKHPAYHTSFKKAELICQEITSDAAALLKSSEYQDAFVRELRERFQSRQEVDYPEAKRIAIVGNSGVGKSTLINALLDNDGLASTGSGGEACTAVVTEFCQPFPQQTTPFQAEINLFGPEQVKIMIKEQFEAYRKFHSEEYDSDEESDDLEEDSSTAFNAFRALFAERFEFRNDEAAHEFLKKALSTEKAQVVDQMCGWVEALRLQLQAQSGPCIRTADTATEISGRLELFVSTFAPLESGNGNGIEQTKANYWPIVELVKIGMYSPLLQRGLVIADLPGRCDTNRIRISATERYINTCYYYVLVADIKRVVSDSSVNHSLQKEARRFNRRNALVCTQIDDLPLSTNVRSLEPDIEAFGEYRKIFQAFTSTKLAQSRCAQNLKKTKGKDREKLAKQIPELKLRLKLYELLLLESLVVMRNKKVEGKIRQKYEVSKANQYALKMHFVSSRHYERHKEGYDDFAPPISLALTGIPNLRSFLSTFPALGRFNVLETHIKGIVPSLIQSMELWSSQTDEARQEQIREVVIKPRKSVETLIRAYIEKLNTLLEIHILAILRSGTTRWIYIGHDIVGNMHKMQWGTLAAKCRRGGIYKPKGKALHSWNDDLLVPVREDITQPWKAFDEEVGQCTEEFKAKLWGMIDGIPEDMRGIEGASVAPLALFLSSLDSKKVQLHQALQNFYAKSMERSRLVRNKVTEEGVDTFLTQAMMPVYKECNEIKGRGKKSRQIERFNRAISMGEPYVEMLPGVQADMERGLEDLHGLLLPRVIEVFDGILKDFDLTFAHEELQNDQRDALQEQLLEFVAEAKSKLNGPIATELAKTYMLSD